MTATHSKKACALAPIVDFHTHAFPNNLAAPAMERLSATSGFTPIGDGTLRSLQLSMEKNGVGRSVVHSIATSPSQTGAIRRWAASIRSTHIIPFPSVHPASPTLIRDLGDLSEDGFKGIKLHPEYQGFRLDEESLEPLYGECERLGLIIFFHMGEDISFPPSDRAAPRLLTSVMRSFPALRLVAAHAGGWRRWEEVAKHLVGEDVYLELGFARGFCDAKLLMDIILFHRPDRLLFGTDFPWDDQGEAIAHVRGMGLPGKLLENILHINAEKLLNIYC